MARVISSSASPRLADSQLTGLGMACGPHRLCLVARPSRSYWPGSSRCHASSGAGSSACGGSDHTPLCVSKTSSGDWLGARRCVVGLHPFDHRRGLRDLAVQGETDPVDDGGLAGSGRPFQQEQPTFPEPGEVDVDPVRKGPMAVSDSRCSFIVRCPACPSPRRTPFRTRPTRARLPTPLTC